MPVLAVLDVHHSRPIAPTRRVALGDSDLPTDPAPGYGGLLLGAVVASYVSDLEPDLLPELVGLMAVVEAGVPVSQPRLRYRFQTDRVGLVRSRFRLLRAGEVLSVDLDVRCTPAQAVLGAVYAVGDVERGLRSTVMGTLRRGARWRGSRGPEMLRYLAGGSGGADVGSIPLAAMEDPTSWALSILGLASSLAGEAPADADAPGALVQQRFRTLLREAHPDHGGRSESAAQRIAELTEARRILLGR